MVLVWHLRSVRVERDINQQESVFLFILSKEQYFSHEREQLGPERVQPDLGYIRDTAHIYPWVQDFELIYVNFFQIYSSDICSTIWGHLDFRLPPLYAAFVNGVAVRDALLFAPKSQ